MNKIHHFIVSFALITLVGSFPAHAVHRGSTVPVVTPTNPVLQTVTVDFGTLTRTGRGGVRLSMMPETSTAVRPVTASGLGVMTTLGPACATWTMTFDHNTSGRPGTDFTVISANTPEGSTAITPIVASGGQNNLAGDYYWNVSCKASDGSSSNVAQLVYHSITNAVNIGSDDRTDFGVFPSGFGNVAGAKILLSTGYAKLTRNDIKLGTSFSNQVVLQDADRNRHSKISNMAITGMSNMKVQGLRFSWDQSTAVTGGSVCTLCTRSSSGTFTNVIFEDNQGYFSEALMGYPAGGGWGAFNFQGCLSGCELNNSGIDYSSGGIGADNGTSATVNNSWLRHIYSDCYFFSNSGTPTGPGWTINDSMCIAPNTRSAVHPDNGQVADQGTPMNTTVNRMIQEIAEGSTNSQGLPFGGGPLGNLDQVLGYVDDGTGSHGPGKVLTLTSGGFGFAANGSYIYSTVGSPVGLTDFVQMTCSGGCAGKTVATLSLASDTNIGSPGSPVHFYSIPSYNFNVHGIVYSGGIYKAVQWSGESGSSSYTNFGIVLHDANPFYQTSFTGTISGNTLTVAGPITNNIPGSVPPYFIADYASGDGGNLKYTGHNWDVGIDKQLTGSTSEEGTYRLLSSPGDIGPIPMISSRSVPVAGAGFYYVNCDVPPLHTGTLTVDSGYANYFSGSCPNVTQTHIIVPVAADFASGMLPKDYLAAVTNAQWSAMTPDQIRTKDCLALKPAIGGQLDAGGGKWYGPFTGETNAGTHTGGGDWITDSTYISDGHHVSGCEAAP